AAIQAGILKPLPRLPKLSISPGVEHGEVATDNLVVAIPLYALSARVPTDHVPVRVDHVDGVVHNPPYEESVQVEVCETAVHRQVSVDGGLVQLLRGTHDTAEQIAPLRIPTLNGRPDQNLHVLVVFIS